MAESGRKRRRKIIYRKKSQNRASMALAIIVMAVILAAVMVRGFSLRRKLDEYNQKKDQLQEEIASEQERSKQIEQYSKYTQTDEYVEEVARDKLGLVKDGETIFRNDSKGETASVGESGTGSTETGSADQNPGEADQAAEGAAGAQ